jgi:uncharacterized membrane protein
MFPRLLTFWHDLRSSLWALPLLMVVGAAAAAILAVHFPIQQGEDPVWFLYSGDAREAPQFLSDLVTAMITMATLVVSITMVVLTLAAQQLGPRLIRSFMADRRTQLTLGLFVATVVYLLLVLRATYGGAKEVPNLAVTGGTALVLMCLVALLVFVHHLARSIIADTIIDRVGASLDDDAERLLPESDLEAVAAPALRTRERGTAITLHHGGYVQTLDRQGMVEIAKRANAVIELAIRVGQHVIAGCTLGWMVPREAVTEDVRESLEKCVVLGGERASIQDLETSIRQLVEVALRALSPSVSDPFSAMAAIDRLTQSFATIMQRGSPQHVWTDDGGTVRLVAPKPSFADLVNVAFRQIRQHSQDQLAVLICLVENFGQLLAQANAGQRPILQRQIELIMEAGRRNIAERDDLKALEQRVQFAISGKASPATATKSEAQPPRKGMRQ